MYKNGFVLAIKDSNENILRDDKNQVELPFYEEYSLILRNKNSSKCIARIFIDGEDILNGKKIIINSFDKVEIERFLDDNLSEGRKFKFVPENDRRIKDKKYNGELGIIEVIFQKEKKTNSISITPFPYIERKIYPYISSYSADIYFSNNTTSKNFCMANGMTGGTARGNKSSQCFEKGNINNLEDDTTTIRIRMLPLSKNESKAIKDTQFIFCMDRGKKNPYTANFCMKCGNKIIKL